MSCKFFLLHWSKLYIVCIYLFRLVCNEPLGDYEKNYIIELTQKYQTSKIINWKYVIRDLEIQFDKLYSGNQVKNYWNSRDRSSSHGRNDPSLRLSQPYFNYTKHVPIMTTMKPYVHKPKFNKPYRMKPY